MGVGMPQALYLEEFGSQVWFAFGTPPYLVGSALTGKTWRDVDIRLILDDEEYDKWNFEFTDGRVLKDPKWISICLAYSALGTRITSLPIDFQIQQQTYANKCFDGARSSIGHVDLRLSK